MSAGLLVLKEPAILLLVHDVNMFVIYSAVMPLPPFIAALGIKFNCINSRTFFSLFRVTDWPHIGNSCLLDLLYVLFVLVPNCQFSLSHLGFWNGTFILVAPSGTLLTFTNLYPFCKRLCDDNKVTFLNVTNSFRLS